MADNGGALAPRLEDRFVKDAANYMLKEGISSGMPIDKVALGLLIQLHEDVDQVLAAKDDKEHLYYCEEIAAIGYALSAFMRAVVPQAPNNGAPDSSASTTTTVDVNKKLNNGDD